MARSCTSAARPTTSRSGSFRALVLELCRKYDYSVAGTMIGGVELEDETGHRAVADYRYHQAQMRGMGLKLKEWWYSIGKCHKEESEKRRERV